MSYAYERSGFAPINGAQLYYEVRGDGPPVLLIHAGIGDSRMWEGQVAALAARYRVIRFDLRGFGRSVMPAGPFANHEDVRGLLSYLDIDKVVLAGCSFGGLIALDVALAYPALVAALVLIGPSVSGATPSDRIRHFWAEEEALLARDDLDGAVELNLCLWVDGPSRTPGQVDPSVRALVTQMQRDAFAHDIPDDIIHSDLEPPAAGRLAELAQPTLVIVGALDLEEKVAQAQAVAASVQNGHLVMMPDTAHLPNMETPAFFNRHLLSFLDQLPA